MFIFTILMLTLIETNHKLIEENANVTANFIENYLNDIETYISGPCINEIINIRNKTGKTHGIDYKYMCNKLTGLIKYYEDAMNHNLCKNSIEHSLFKIKIWHIINQIML